MGFTTSGENMGIRGRRGIRARDRIAYTLSTARGVPIEYDLRPYASTVQSIRTISLERESDASLSRMAVDLRSGLRSGAGPAEALPACYALAAEASRRRLGLRPFDGQLVAGTVMHQGKLVQMPTGEGKTLAAVFPACLSALSGRHVHILTANDYLAQRDAQWMGPIYDLLGVSVATITADSSTGMRRSAYQADVTYLTAREAGFDYLRDGLCTRREDLVQGALEEAIVDEADFLLIDEARVPLVIAGAARLDAVDLGHVEAVARGMQRGRDYAVDREGRRIDILLAGHRVIEAAFGVAGIHEEKGADCFARVYASLHAHELLRCDVDYVVKDGRIGLVDEHTGRIADRRQWPWGIQAALEAKEGLSLRAEGRVYGSITVQHFMGLYGQIAAMTATAVPSAVELSEVYGLSTVIIPAEKPLRRIDEPDMVFLTREKKLRALVEQIVRSHAEGRPVLVGTCSVKESREVADRLRTGGVGCEVLNAADDAREAELIAMAGQRGAVTISTNMAGRGTDIRLADDPVVRESGGLLVIGTNRHESRRVDDQLRGRAGRQGEPGASRFFVSLEDPLFVRYGVPEFLPRGCSLDDPRVLREIDRAQSIIEAQHHTVRKLLRKYSQLVELDRRRVRALRDATLREGVLPELIEESLPFPKARTTVLLAWVALLDSFWADHLLLVEEVREGIHLERYAGRDPGLEYIHRVGGAFDRGLAAVEEAVAIACARLPDDPDALSLTSLGIQAPSTTWTYQVDDEAPIRFSIASTMGSGIADAIAAGPLMIIESLGRMVRRLRPGRMRDRR
jgi:preprotein translocase subunit SecA